MADDLAKANIAVKQRLMNIIVASVASVWHGLAHYDREQLDQFLATVLPLTAAANAQAVALTEAFLAQALGRPPLGVDPQQVVAGIRNGVTPEQVYERSFIAVWSALKQGAPWEQAAKLGLDRATSAAATDVQLSFTHTLRAVGTVDRHIGGFRRIPDPTACDFCRAASGQLYHTGDLMPLHNHCITGDSIVSTAPSSGSAETSDGGCIQAVTRRWYPGELVRISRATGKALTVTPNHPILTDRGWVAAGLLREGDHVISSLRADREHCGIPDEQHMPARIEDLFGALGVSGLVSVPFAAEHFHDDLGDGEVSVVSADRSLDARAAAALVHPTEQLPLALRRRAAASLARLGREHLRGERLRLAANGCVCGRHASFADLRRLRSSGNAVLLRQRAANDPSFHEMAINDSSVGAVALRDRQHRFASQIGLDRVGQINTPGSRQSSSLERPTERRLADAADGRRVLRRLAGQVSLDRVVQLDWVRGGCHIFNLVTRDGWYFADGIANHNCGCGVAPVGDLSGGRAPSTFAAPSGVQVAVRQHGELGPVLTNAADHFLGSAAHTARL